MLALPGSSCLYPGSQCLLEAFAGSTARSPAVGPETISSKQYQSLVDDSGIQILNYVRRLVAQLDDLLVSVVLDGASVGQHRKMCVDETRTDAPVTVTRVLTFEERDLIGHVADRGRTGLGGEILDCDPAAMVREKLEYR